MQKADRTIPIARVRPVVGRLVDTQRKVDLSKTTKLGSVCALGSALTSARSGRARNYIKPALTSRCKLNDQHSTFTFDRK